MSEGRAPARFVRLSARFVRLGPLRTQPPATPLPIAMEFASLPVSVVAPPPLISAFSLWPRPATAPANGPRSVT